FLQIGVAASALPLAVQAARASEPLGSLDSAAAPAVALYKVVYDVRFAESVAFARRVAAQGVTVHPIEGDMTRFWYDDLYHRWQRGPAAIAGLTAHGAMFCFERLALDQRMRVVFRAEHAPAPDGVQHRVNAPLGLIHDARQAAAGGGWAARFADLVTRCPSGRTELGSVAACGPANAVAAVAAAEPLYTWLIAPAQRAAATV
ncbi:MAG TPA: hypothetical protein VFJ95_02150, partial [Gammaproteobacteria bacterium]|nr:hypothetical protein [Gammaproteobacteria bacterium]